MRQCPMAASAVNPIVSQQEGKQLQAFAAKVVCRLAGPYKISHRLMRRVRRRSPSVAGPVQSRQRDRVAPVCLDPLARRFGIEAGATTMQSWPSALIWR